VTLHNTWEDVQKQVSGSNTGSVQAYDPELTMLSRFLNHLRVFIDAVSNEVKSGGVLPVFMGFVSLVVKACESFLFSLVAD
jgi:hypothetical protein